MIKRNLAILLLLAPVALAFGQKKYTIDGKLKGVEDGVLIRLMRNEGNLLTTIGTDTVKNGSFGFSGEVTDLTALAVTGYGSGFPSQWLDIWVLPGSSVGIAGENKLLKTWKVSSKVPEQRVQQRFMQASKGVLDELQGLSAQESDLLARREGADEATTKRIWAGVDSLRQIQDGLRSKVSYNELTMLATMKKHDRVWMDVLNSLARTVRYGSDTVLRRRVIDVYRGLSNEEKNGDQGSEIRVHLFPPVVVKVGEQIADTVMRDLEGNNRRLADYRGKYLLIDFWSVGCGPCIMAMPELKALHERMQDKVEVISFTTDRSVETWKKACASFKMDWNNLSDGKGTTGLAAKFGVSGIPHYVIISPEGVLLDSWVGHADGLLAKKVAQHVKN